MKFHEPFVARPIKIFLQKPHFIVWIWDSRCYYIHAKTYDNFIKIFFCTNSSYIQPLWAHDRARNVAA